MRLVLFCVVSHIVLGGCDRLAGLEREYVLREPITIALDGRRQAITIPAGTRVKQTSLKDDTAFVVVRGRTNRHQLERAGKAKQRPTASR